MTTEIKKALLPRIVADRIDDLRGHYGKSNEYIAELWMRTGGGVPAATTDLRQVSFDTLMTALLVGYEREKTPEETIAEIYHNLTESAREARGMYNGDPTRYTMAALTLKRVIGLLDVVIPGVNDTEVNA
jgi:hypothetical protein